MTMYRVLRKLDIGKGRVLHPGSFSRLEWLDEQGIARLEQKGSIGRVHPPPLAALPGWSRRAKKAREVTGVENAEQLLEVDDQSFADAMGVQVETVRRWKTDVRGWLTADPAPTG